MISLLLSWKEAIFFAALFIFLFTPLSRGLRIYALLGISLYLLNKPLIANLHPGDIRWWLSNPAAWIIAVSGVGGLALSLHWFKDIKGHGVRKRLAGASWQPHLIAFSLVLLAIFLFDLSLISPQFKTRADLSFALLVVILPLQYFMGLYLLKSFGESFKRPITLVLAAVLFCIFLVSLLYLQRTLSEYKDLFTTMPTRSRASELIKRWEAVIEKNDVAAVNSIRSTAYGRIGDLNLSLGDLDGARQGYKKALRDGPDDVAGSIGLARLLIREARAGQAREALQVVIKRNPSLSWERFAQLFPPLQFQEIWIVAEALEAENKQEEAFFAYREASTMKPEDPRVNLGLGKIYLVQGDYEEAAAAFQKTLAKAPRHLYALSYLVDIYEKEGDVDLAQKYRNIILTEVVTHRILPSDWRGATGGRLYRTGGCSAKVRLYQGTVNFTIHARGAPARGVWPHMVVKLNEAIIGEIDVTSDEWRPYSFAADVGTGEYRLWVYFANDLLLSKKVDGRELGEHRNLFVRNGEIRYVR